MNQFIKEFKLFLTHNKLIINDTLKDFNLNDYISNINFIPKSSSNQDIEVEVFCILELLTILNNHGNTNKMLLKMWLNSTLMFDLSDKMLEEICRELLELSELSKAPKYNTKSNPLNISLVDHVTLLITLYNYYFIREKFSNYEKITLSKLIDVFNSKGYFIDEKSLPKILISDDLPEFLDYETGHNKEGEKHQYELDLLGTLEKVRENFSFEKYLFKYDSSKHLMIIYRRGLQFIASEYSIEEDHLREIVIIYGFINYFLPEKDPSDFINILYWFLKDKKNDNNLLNSVEKLIEQKENVTLDIQISQIINSNNSDDIIDRIGVAYFLFDVSENRCESKYIMKSMDKFIREADSYISPNIYGKIDKSKILTVISDIIKNYMLLGLSVSKGKIERLNIQDKEKEKQIESLMDCYEIDDNNKTTKKLEKFYNQTELYKALDNINFKKEKYIIAYSFKPSEDTGLNIHPCIIWHRRNREYWNKRKNTFIDEDPYKREQSLEYKTDDITINIVDIRKNKFGDADNKDVINTVETNHKEPNGINSNVKMGENPMNYAITNILKKETKPFIKWVYCNYVSPILVTNEKELIRKLFIFFTKDIMSKDKISNFLNMTNKDSENFYTEVEQDINYSSQDFYDKDINNIIWFLPKTDRFQNTTTTVRDSNNKIIKDKNGKKIIKEINNRDIILKVVEDFYTKKVSELLKEYPLLIDGDKYKNNQNLYCIDKRHNGIEKDKNITYIEVQRNALKYMLTSKGITNNLGGLLDEIIKYITKKLVYRELNRLAESIDIGVTEIQKIIAKTEVVDINSIRKSAEKNNMNSEEIQILIQNKEITERNSLNEALTDKQITLEDVQMNDFYDVIKRFEKKELTCYDLSFSLEQNKLNVSFYQDIKYKIKDKIKHHNINFKPFLDSKLSDSEKRKNLFYWFMSLSKETWSSPYDFYSYEKFENSPPIIKIRNDVLNEFSDNEKTKILSEKILGKNFESNNQINDILESGFSRDEIYKILSCVDYGDFYNSFLFDKETTEKEIVNINDLIEIEKKKGKKNDKN